MNAVKKNPISFRFTPEARRALELISESEGRSLTKTMEWLVRKHCEREGLDWPVASVVPTIVQTSSTESQRSVEPGNSSSQN